MTTVIARTAARLVIPITIVTALALTLQGHNLPGGGFIGGVLTATAFALAYVVFGLDFVADVLGIHGAENEAGHGPITLYQATFAVGLGVAVGSGIVPVFFGYPFLTQDFWIFHLPLFGEFEVASSTAFDLGVYLTVVGALLTAIGMVGAE